MLIFHRVGTNIFNSYFILVSLVPSIRRVAQKTNMKNKTSIILRVDNSVNEKKKKSRVAKLNKNPES